MAKLYFRYGNGKSAQLCQVAYNYMNERDMPNINKELVYVRK